MDSFTEVQKACSLFSDLPCPWFICGGWAIDLFLNRVTRQHKDLDIAIARTDQVTVRGYLAERGWNFEKARDGKLLPWVNEEWLALPNHVIWCKNAGHDPDFIELLFNEIDQTHFRFRRDQSITMVRERMFFRTPSGWPVLAPEIVLLYKSNGLEEYNIDFENTVGSLSDQQRYWLRTALKKLFVEHSWIDRLDEKG